MEDTADRIKKLETQIAEQRTQSKRIAKALHEMKEMSLKL